MYKGKKISVVIPCYNEELGISKVLELIPTFIDEIIVIDDASTDNTAREAAKAGVKIIHHDSNLGYGASLKTGFKHALGDIIITCDGDRTYPVEHCQRILERMLEDNLDFISCRRFPLMIPESMELSRKVGNYIIACAVNLLFGLRLKDALSGMWVFRKAILPLLNLESNNFAFTTEIKIEAFTNPAVKAKEMPIIYDKREGKSKIFAIHDGLRILRSILKKRFQLRKNDNKK